jgi:tetratricopeptide (TPR) repeat protein
MNQGKALNAKDAFEKAVAADPKLAGALNGLGWVAISQGKTEDAVEYWKKAIAAAPATTAALNGLAMTYANLGEFGKSIEAYQQWLKVEPENKDAKAGLEKAKQDDKALLAGAESWLGLLDRGEYVKAWEQAGPMLRSIVDDKNMFATVTKAVRDDVGKVKSRKLDSRQLMMSIPGMIGGPFQVLRYDTQFQKKHMNENVIMQKGRLGTWGVVGYTVAPYSMTMPGVVVVTTANEKDVPKEATAAAEQWLGLVDAGKYAESWDTAAEMFQKAVGKQEWERQVGNARSPLGKLKARKFVHAANVSTQPDGPVDKNALIFQFQAAYEKRDKAVETVSLRKGKDGKWQVAGYFIK